ncbi:hypothetical protein CAL7102_01847 [Dulcicalothrix desertica PCC 7102]|nr:hypothetical protein CAL7102_01847 [Dulcicalothrix desertica PCC 7102]
MKLQDIIKLNQSFKFDYLSQDPELAREVQICLINIKFLVGAN